MSKPNGYVLYDGPSLLTHDSIICIATGFAEPSANPKTGPMIQVWVLNKNQHPIEAIQSGSDRSVCGLCPLRGEAGRNRKCYVQMAFGPANVWKAHQRGLYPAITDFAVFERRLVRFGAYGDPAAVPLSIWDAVANRCAGFTGYTHQWRTADHRYSQYFMASADSVADRAAAKALGYRVFRVRAPGATDRLAGEAVCPASAEAGYKLQCHSCLVCCGTSRGLRGDVVISAHGSAHVLNAYRETEELRVAA